MGGHVAQGQGHEKEVDVSIWGYERQCKEYDLDESEIRNMQAHRRVIHRFTDLNFQAIARLYNHGQDMGYILLEEEIRRVGHKLQIMDEWAGLYGYRW